MSKSPKIVLVVTVPPIILGLCILAAEFYLKNFAKPCKSVGFQPCLNGTEEYLFILASGVVLSIVTFGLLLLKLKTKK